LIPCLAVVYDNGVQDAVSAELGTLDAIGWLSWQFISL